MYRIELEIEVAEDTAAILINTPSNIQRFNVPIHRKDGAAAVARLLGELVAIIVRKGLEQ